MLARLAEETGLQVVIDREGQILRASGQLMRSSGSDVRSIVEQLGYFIDPLPDPPHVERWYALDQVEELSTEEAEILAKRWASELEADNVIPDAGLIVGPLRTTLERSFKHASATGVVGDIRLSLEDFGDVLSETEIRRLQSWIMSKLRSLDHPA